MRPPQALTMGAVRYVDSGFFGALSLSAAPITRQALLTFPHG